MSKKFNANYYTCSKVRFKNREYVRIDGGGYLFSNGIYFTKIRPEDLPESYVEGVYYGYNKGFLNAAGVKDLLYVPNYHVNHMFKDDFLYISYDEPLFLNPNRGLGERVLGYDEYVWGYNIVHFLKAAEKYSGFDISNIKDEIEKKRAHFEATYPSDYSHEVGDYDFWKED